jgi:KUP system potassium uptake protein
VLTVVVEPVPKTGAAEGIEMEHLGAGFYRLVPHYGFMQKPNIPSGIGVCSERGLTLDLGRLHYFVGHVDLLEGRRRRGIQPWRDRLFIALASNTVDATADYQIPAGQVMKVGLQVGI